MSINLSNKNLVDVENIFSEIINPEKYTSIDLSNNLLTNLPKNISLFKSLHTLNITNNKFTDYNSIAQILSSLPELQDLNIDLSTQENVLIILSALPDLVTLNGQLTLENTSLQESFLSQSNNNIFNNNEKKNEISLNEETNEFEFIYKELNNDEFNKKFQEKLREEITKINNNLEISNKLYNAVIVKSKLEIYSFILDEVFNLLINNTKNLDNIIKIVIIVKDKLKYNQNLLFEFVMNDTNNNINTNDNRKVEFNKNNHTYEITKEISIMDNLLPYNKEQSFNKTKIIPKNNLISLLDQIYEYKTKNNLDYFSAIIPSLTAKFGLKSIANFWYRKILEGIDYYTNNEVQDKYSEIYLFKKILEKKLDVYFYYKYKKTKMKYINFINSMKTFLENNKIKEGFNYEEGMKMLLDNIDKINENKDINKNDVLEGIHKLKIKRNDTKKEEYNNLIKVLCEDFIKILLEIYINKKENQYNLFLNNFQIYDKDGDGLVNKEEFIEIIYLFKNEYILNNNKIIPNLCSELFQRGKCSVSVNNCIEILFKTNINNNKNLFDILTS